MTTRVACALAGLVTVLGVAAVLYSAYGVERSFSSPADVLAGGVTSLAAVLFVGAGVAIVLRARAGGRRIGGLLVLSGLALTASSVGSGLGQLYSVGTPVPFGPWFAWIDDWVWVLLLSGTWLTLVLFPDGRATTRTARVTVVLACVLTVCVLATFPFTPGRLVDLPGVANPVPPVPVLSDLSGPVHAVLLPAMIGMFALSLLCLVLRYRVSGPLVRAQIRWLAWAATVTVLCVLAQNLTPRPWSDAIAVATLFTMPLLPAAVAVAVLRYRLYDVDRLLSRTVSYALLTGLLVAVYAGIVALAGTLVPAWSGSVGVAAATLAAVSLVRPLRRVLQDAVDRRFDRARSDARRAVTAYAGRLRVAEPDHDHERDLLEVLDRTVAPTRAWLWQPSR